MTSPGPDPLVLAHDDEGSGPAVVLLHSAVTDRGMWAEVASGLDAGHRVVRPDLRGFGDTPMPGGSYADADDVVNLMDVLGLASATVVEMLLDEEGQHLAALSDFIGKPISLQAEPIGSPEQYDIVLM